MVIYQAAANRSTDIGHHLIGIQEVRDSLGTDRIIDQRSSRPHKGAMRPGALEIGKGSSGGANAVH